MLRRLGGDLVVFERVISQVDLRWKRGGNVFGVWGVLD